VLDALCGAIFWTRPSTHWLRLSTLINHRSYFIIVHLSSLVILQPPSTLFNSWIWRFIFCNNFYGVKSGTGPRFFWLALTAVIGYNDNDEKRNRRMCVVPKLRGLKLLAFDPQPRQRTDCPLAKGWGRGKAFIYLTKHPLTTTEWGCKPPKENELAMVQKLVPTNVDQWRSQMLNPNQAMTWRLAKARLSITTTLKRASYGYSNAG
jgi:hypothetical protein